MTKAEFEAKLERDLASGKITAEESELEWQDWMHKNEVWMEF